MKRLLLALALLANHGLLADRALAQDAPKSFTLTVEAQDLQILSAGLSELPYKVAAPLMAKLQGQIVKQHEASKPTGSPVAVPENGK